MNISVVIPAYNEEDNIGTTLSLLEPQLKDGDEIIVMDNGSTDDTMDIALSFDDVVVIHAPDEAIGAEGRMDSIKYLMQIGTEEAQNEIVASTDADTLPPEGWLGRIRLHFIQDKDLSLVWGVAVDSGGIPIRDMTGKYLSLFGGASGCNVAFRKSEFEKLEDGYVNSYLTDDVTLITRMSKVGKTVHDENLKMVTHLDRQRYQTIPIVATGLGSMVIGTQLKGKKGDILKGGGISMIGTEVLYERIGNNFDHPDGWHIHHDQAGTLAVLAGEKFDSSLLTGAGVGVVAHHFLTEGASPAPTGLNMNTDKIIEAVQ